jgi:hypothetical protein
VPRSWSVASRAHTVQIEYRVSRMLQWFGELKYGFGTVPLEIVRLR